MTRQFGIAVVQQVLRLNAFRLVWHIRLAMRREGLLFQARSVHQLRPTLDIGGGVRDRMACDAGRLRHADRGPEAIAHEVAEFFRNVVGVNIADHGLPPVGDTTMRRARHRACSVICSGTGGSP